MGCSKHCLPQPTLCYYSTDLTMSVAAFLM